MGGLYVSADTMDCENLDDVDICGAMNATTVHEIIAMSAGEHPDVKDVKTEVKSILEWKANLRLDKNRVRHAAQWRACIP